MSENLSTLSMLNQRQLDAVSHTEGPLLVLAGAGTGKTRVLIARFVQMLQQGVADIDSILLVTFTNKAASEMKERLQAMLGRPVGYHVWIGTFHAICMRILREQAHYLNIDRNFVIIDAEDQIKFIKQIVQLDGVGEKQMIKKVAYAINRYADLGLMPDEVPFTEPEEFRTINKIYRERLALLNTFDFGGLILGCIHLFKQFPEVLEMYQDQLRYLMVDEYQDTNTAQYIWLSLLAKKHRNLCCVGDEDQSIYAWRGADINNILRFEKDFPNSQTIRLEQNYRSSAHVVKAASNLIQNNNQRLGKTLWTEDLTGERLTVQGAWDTDDEARLIIDRIQKLHADGTRYCQMAVLVRASFQTREIEERLIKMEVPYHIVSGINFYDRQEIRDVLAYFRIIIQAEDGISFERILNLPKRGVGLTSIRRIQELARTHNLSFTSAARMYADSDGHQNSKVALKKFFTQIDGWKNLFPQMDHVSFAHKILDDSGYLDMWKQDKSADAAARLENIKELLANLREFKDLKGFVEYVSLLTDQNQYSNADCVKIMTLHAAKGLEFDYVFLPGWEEGIFPYQKAISEGGEKGIEEERRLAYVGLTRARRFIFISYTMQRRYYHSWQTNIPSRFIKELPQDHICHYNPNGIEIRKPPEDDFIIGERVYHEKYGHGDIIDLDAYGLYIKFDTSGVKKISQKFVVKAMNQVGVGQ